MSKVEYFCPRCGFSTREPILRCPTCKSLMVVKHSFKWFIDYSRRGIYKFYKMLPPIAIENSLDEGFTPLIKSKRISIELRIDNLYFKDEGRNPTGSFRDRVAALFTSHAYEIGYNTLVCATDGNLGASLAAYSARLGLNVKAVIPRGSDWGKIVLMKSYGAEIIEHGESLDDAYAYASTYAERERLYNATSESNALSIEALKTISFELFLELKKQPDHIFIPIGSGLTLYSIYYGFRELLEHKLIDKIPSIHGIETCWNPRISHLLGKKVSRCKMEPIIGLAYHYPPLEKEVVKVISETQGKIWVVDKNDIVASGEELARKEGLFVEPAASTSYAGFKKAIEQGFIDSREVVVVLLTGHGLKAYEKYAAKRKTRAKTLFPKETKLEIIKTLYQSPSPLTGYILWKKLGINISVQAIYQHLSDLEKKGIVKSTIEYGKKYYTLTLKGKRIAELLLELTELLS